MIEVFKTNVSENCQAAKLKALLSEYFPDTRINFDLEDCDKVLRMEGLVFIPLQVKSLVEENGFLCNILD
jgi:hypothetical protein